MYYLAPLYGFGSEEVIEENAAIPADDILIDDFIREEDLPAPEPAPAAPAEDDAEAGEVTIENWMIPTPLATQIFSIVPGVAGGLAGFIFASKLSNARRVDASEVLIASGLVAIVTFLSVFIVRTVEDIE